jgi:ubiquinone/menaquinone biosynthesis C-methylase UbiE
MIEYRDLKEYVLCWALEKINMASDLQRENWIEFWDGQTVFSDTFFYEAMNIFLERSAKLLKPGPNDIVLDIGCGAGVLPQILHEKVKEIHCVDTSPQMIDKARKLMAGAGNVYFYHLDPDNFTDLTMFEDKKFDLVITASVVQYYPDISHLEKLIKEIVRISKPEFRAIITDIHNRHSLVKDAGIQLWESLKKMYVFEVVNAFVKAKFLSNYMSVKKTQGYLTTNKNELESLFAKLRIKAEVREDSLTVNGGRFHLFFHS